MNRILHIRRALRKIAPTLGLLIAILITVTPIEIGLFGLAVPMPVLPMIIVFLYAVYDPIALPTPIVFGLGLLHDALYGGAIGAWASIYVALQYLVLTQRDYFRGRLPHVIWLAFALALILVAPLLWAERSLIASRFLAPWTLIAQFGVTVAAYPFVSMLFFMLREREVTDRIAL